MRDKLNKIRQNLLLNWITDIICNNILKKNRKKENKTKKKKGEKHKEDLILFIFQTL